MEASQGSPSQRAAVRYGSAGRGPSTYLVFWGLVWAAQWWVAPTWLVGSRSGLQTALQVLPAVVVAIFVLVLGSLFVLGQQAVALHGARAVLVLPFNRRVQAVVWRPLLITAAALLLSGQVPDHGDTAPAVTAAVATMILATIAVLAYSATSLVALYSEFTGPVVFGQQVLAGVQEHLERGKTGLVVFRAGLLTEMLGQAIARGDSTAIAAALHGIDYLHEAYIAASEKNPDARRHTYDDGTAVQAWLAYEVPQGMVAAALDGLAASRASEEDVIAIVDTIERIGERAARSKHSQEFEAALESLCMIATCVQQVQPSGAINHPGRTLTDLAQLEREAEQAGETTGAAGALASMMLVLSYVEAQFGQEHRGFDSAVRLLGDDPPYDEATGILRSQEWLDRWVNKLPPGPDAVRAPTAWLRRTRDAHAVWLQRSTDGGALGSA